MTGKEQKLTPTESLLIELLIARTRLGETIWTVEKSAATLKAARRLEGFGLIDFFHGSVENTFRASLTNDAKNSYMARPYAAPILEPLRTLICGTEWDVTCWRDNWRKASQALDLTYGNHRSGDGR